MAAAMREKYSWRRDVYDLGDAFSMPVRSRARFDPVSEKMAAHRQLCGDVRALVRPPRLPEAVRT